MITVVRVGGHETSKIAEIVGLSKDVTELPLDVPNGSQFYCMDNGDVYMFDKENVRWILQKF